MKKMDFNTEFCNFIKRAQNFHLNHKQFEKQLNASKPFYMNILKLKNEIIDNLGQTDQPDRKKLLETVFSEIYDFTSQRFVFFTYFLKGSSFHDHIYEACLFTSLCMFIHITNRINGSSLGQFIYDNSLYDFNDQQSPNYCPPNYYSDILLKKENNLRKERNDILSSRSVYDRRPQWNAMADDSMHEWILYFILTDKEKAGDDTPSKRKEWASAHGLTAEDYEILRDTFKRIGNLYNEVYTAVNSPKDDAYLGRLQNADDKFMSKLQKLKYENYIELQKIILSHLSESKEYWGINLYRFEKELKPYIITNEVKHMLECNDDDEKHEILTKSIILKDIHFPKLYKDFAALPVYSDIELCANYFPVFQNLIVTSNCLIIDELIENGYLGSDWKLFFYDTINGMVKNVFYDPEKIDYTITPESQREFMEILAAPVHSLLDKLIEAF